MAARMCTWIAGRRRGEDGVGRYRHLKGAFLVAVKYSDYADDGNIVRKIGYIVE